MAQQLRAHVAFEEDPHLISNTDKGRPQTSGILALEEDLMLLFRLCGQVQKFGQIRTYTHKNKS